MYNSRIMIFHLVVVIMAFFLLAYRYYGRFLGRKFNVSDPGPTPAHEMNDGIDHVPARTPLLLAQHFSAIAAAGPIVGPILASIWFGWVPAVLWIVFGAVFIGGVHDLGSISASMRHRALSIGEVVKLYMPRAYRYFLVFVWLALVYVIIAFTDITAHTFKTVMSGEPFGAAVAASSGLYLLAAVVMGFLLYKFRMRLWIATVIFIPLTLFIIWIGPHLPGELLGDLSEVSVRKWDVIILAYCFVASLIPVWLLLQPRGYLGGWFLYLVIIIGLAGALFGGFRIEYPAFDPEGLAGKATGKPIFPLLFITIACGAVSGFHGIVGSGTTSKQVDRFRDAVPIGYGAMLLEGMVAILALTSVMMLVPSSPALKSDPNLIYAEGIARSLGLIGIGREAALGFALLAFSTFVYDTLDVCTRLTRYIFQELTGWSSFAGGILATFVSLFVPVVFLLLTEEKGYLAAWPIFGASNQLLAALILLAISAWLVKSGKNAIFAIVPMIFMMIMSMWALADLSMPFIGSFPELLSGGQVARDVIIRGVCGTALLALALALVVGEVGAVCSGRGRITRP